MNRATFIRILTAIKLVSNNVSVIENFRNKALITIQVPEVVGESAKQLRSLRKVLSYCSYVNIKPENDGLVVTLEFEWD